jgi:Putative MetA-pathway of phenol degradation
MTDCAPTAAIRSTCRSAPLIRGLYVAAWLAFGVPVPVRAQNADDSTGSSLPPITPYRPTVSDPAQLPAPGQLELELGGLRMVTSDPRRSSTPYLLKLAFNDEWGVLIGGDAYVWMQGELNAPQGAGDTTVTLKRAWTVDKASALGLEFEIKLPTADNSIGSGKADYTLNGIYSHDFTAVHMDLNLNVSQLGQADPGSSHSQLGGAMALSAPLTKRWGITGEISGNQRAGAENGFQVLSALTFSPSNRLTFDLGFVRAFRPRPAATSLFTGVVLPLAQLW